MITIALQYPSVVARRSDARRRAIAATSELVQEQGYAATGLEEILSRSGAPKGSFYFHFPGGKEQLVAEAVAASGDGIRQLIDAVVSDAKTPQEAIRAIASFQARQLAESGFEHGCPIATVTLEVATRSDQIRVAASGAYESWIAVLAEALERQGHPDSVGFATFALAALEGALVLARAVMNADIVVDVGDRIASLIWQQSGQPTDPQTG